MPVHLRDLATGPGAPGEFAACAAAWLGVPEAGVTCSGTAALMSILTALRRLSAAGTVIVPAFTCPLVVRAIHAAGLHAQPCDITPDGFDLDPRVLEALCGADTLAVIPTHLAGRVADVERVASIAHACGAFVIEDAAQAFGARHLGQTVGWVGDASFFSFAVGKGLTLYEGGLWIARNEALRALIRQAECKVPVQPVMELRRALQLLGTWALYRPLPLRVVYGWPLRQALRAGDEEAAAGDHYTGGVPFHRMGRWRQAVGASMLPRLLAFQAAGRERALPRVRTLQRIDGLRVLQDRPGDVGVWPCLVVHVSTVAACRDILSVSWGAGLGVSRLFARALPAYADLRLTEDAASCPHAQAFAAQTFTISNSHWLDEARFARIVRTIEGVLSRPFAPAPSPATPATAD